jgi:Arc/MetJ family transcription regulator
MTRGALSQTYRLCHLAKHINRRYRMHVGVEMRTTLNLDDEALEAAMQVSEGRTKTDVVNEALRRFARAKRRHQLLDLRGKVEWTGNIDALRKRG